MADFILEHMPSHFRPIITEFHCWENSFSVWIRWLLPALPWKISYKRKQFKVSFANKLRGKLKYVFHW